MGLIALTGSEFLLYSIILLAAGMKGAGKFLEAGTSVRLLTLLCLMPAPVLHWSCASRALVLQDTMEYHDTITFKANTAQLKEAGFYELNKIARLLSERPLMRYKIISFVQSQKDSLANLFLARRRAKTRVVTAQSGHGVARRSTSRFPRETRSW